MMKKLLTLLTCLLLIAGFVQAQGRYFTKSGKVIFYSNAPLEDIEASTKTAAAVLDVASGTLQFSVLLKSFEFRKALMQEHFNDDYVESDKYPNSEFKGTIVNNAAINYGKPGTYPAQIKGKLTLHGVTKDVATSGTITVDADGLKTSSVFTISLSDYDIKRPALVKSKISNTIKITVDCRLDALKG